MYNYVDHSAIEKIKYMNRYSPKMKEIQYKQTNGINKTNEMKDHLLSTEAIKSL